MQKHLTVCALALGLALASCNKGDNGTPQECANAAGDLSMQALERTSNATATVGDSLHIRCVIRNIAPSSTDCDLDTPAAKGFMEIGYSPVFTPKFADYDKLEEGEFDVKPLEPSNEQRDLVGILPDKKGWYAVQIRLNTGANPVKETDGTNNVMAVAVEVK